MRKRPSKNRARRRKADMPDKSKPAGIRMIPLNAPPLTASELLSGDPRVKFRITNPDGQTLH